MKKLESTGMKFGAYGGRYVPEMLVPPLEELDETFSKAIKDEEFLASLHHLQAEYVGRPSVLYKADNLAKVLHREHDAPQSLKIYLKREGLNHTGAHKINNTIGQVLLAKRMGKTHIVAETGAGQHGLATAAVCAKFDMKCKVFMGEVDMKRQYPNVFAMKQMGAEVIPVLEGSRTLKDAVNAALKYWVEHVDDTHYLLGSALGPHPYPKIVQFFQSIIGEEAKTQLYDKEGRLPSSIIACVGGGSNSLGIFTAFLDDPVSLIGVEAGGLGLESGQHAARFSGGEDQRVGIAQGYKSYFLQDEEAQIADTYSISAGLDYAGISPQLAYLHDIKRVSFMASTDEQALQGYTLLARTEGMLPALETAHAVGALPTVAAKAKDDDIIVVNLSGRGDKDLFIVAPSLSSDEWNRFLAQELKKNTRKDDVLDE